VKKRFYNMDSRDSSVFSLDMESVEGDCQEYETVEGYTIKINTLNGKIKFTFSRFMNNFLTYIFIEGNVYTINRELTSLLKNLMSSLSERCNNGNGSNCSPSPFYFSSSINSNQGNFLKNNIL